MWDFDNDEWAFFLAAAAAVVIGGVLYYRPLISISRIGKSGLCRGVLGCLPIVAILPTLIVLCRWADAQVVGHLDYIILFLLGAGAWIFSASKFISVLGISLRDDAIERDNPAAMIAVCGTLFGVGIVYALSNIGTGPTIWTTIFPALVATIILALISLLIELTGGAVAETITIDRDVATALRLAGALVGCAIILGSAAAGDWVSWNQTWTDLVRDGWPAVMLAIAAGVSQRLQRPTAARPQPDVVVSGIVPATLFVAVAILIVIIVRKDVHPIQ